MWSLCSQGKRHILLTDMVDHRRDERAIDKHDAFLVTMKNGVKRRLETTQGWQLLCEWKDGSSNWVALKDAQQSYPVLVAEYAIANRIDDKLAFAWWVPGVIKKRDRIIAKVKSKFGNGHISMELRSPRPFEKHGRLTRRMAPLYGGMQYAKRCATFDLWEKNEGELPPAFQKIK